MQIEVRNGAFHYPNGKSVLQSVNFSFDGRGVFAVLGPNGAGKTTLLKCLLGLLPWSSGASFFNGRDRREWSTREFWRRTAYVPQARASAFAPLTLRELVVLGRSARIGAFSQPSRTDWTACDHAMELVGIRVLAERLTTEVSGGQLQLAYIARALAAEPELLVLDEPESSLDFKNQAAVLNVIEQLTSSGLGVIINTHFPAHALARAASGILVPQGKPPIFGTAAELFSEAKLSALSTSASARLISTVDRPRLSPPSPEPQSLLRTTRTVHTACRQLPQQHALCSQKTFFCNQRFCD